MDESKLDENRIGRKKLDENRLDKNRLDENWAHDRGVVSQDRNSIPPNRFHSRYPPIPHHLSIEAIKKQRKL